MILRVKDNGKVHTIQHIASIKTSSNTIKVSGNKANELTITCRQESFTSWYNTYVENKITCMCIGGSPHKDQEFTSGLRGSTFDKGIKHLCYAGASTDGNIQLLPGKTLDVSTKDDENTIVLSQINIPTSSGLAGALTDLSRCVWYLYHTYNSFLYRLHKFDVTKTAGPMFGGARLLGTIPSYQAAVAAWNLKVWRRSFLFDYSSIRENMSFSLGYMAIGCVVKSVICSVEILVEAAADNSISYYTIYQQGVSTNIDSKSVVIKKDSNVISGNGTDAMSESGAVWSKITIDIALPTLNQGDYYKAVFTLAIAQNSITAQTYDGLREDMPHTLSISTAWTTEGELYTLEKESFTLPSLVIATGDDDEAGTEG